MKARFQVVFRWLLSTAPAMVLAFCLPAAIHAQQAPGDPPLTIRQAVTIALEKNPQRKAALAETKAASASVKEAQSFLLPHVAFSETATRGNDPVYVFGSKLRQHRFTTTDFDLNKLNTPTPLNNFSSRLGGTWNLFDSLASRRSLKRAERMDDASKNQLDRTEQEIVSRVVDSYYNVLLAKKALDVADQALKTAQAILERSKNRFESGLSVESDLLSATVRAAARREEQIRARNNLELARAQLSTAMGLSTQGGFEPQDVLAERNFSMDSVEELEKRAVDARPDLKHLRATEAAQDQSVTIAKYSFGPRVNAFGSWELDNPTFFPGGGGNNWIAGVEVQFDLFQGGAKRAQLTQQKAMKEKIAAIKESASDEVRLEVRRAYYDVDSARQQIEVARATVQQSAESLRIIENRYEAGLLTITDLLSAEEAAHRSQTDYWDAVYRYHTGYAHLELATGTLNPQSPVVNP